MTRTRHAALAAAATAWMTFADWRPALGVGAVSWVASAHAAEAMADCPQHFADGRPPALERARMSERATPVLCRQGYAVLASGITKGPLWSAEHLTAQTVAAARRQAREGGFREEAAMPAGDRALLSDYRGSGYDRGHMTPSGDMPTEASQQETFTLANVVPQAPALNRGVWEAIESAVRDMAAKRGSLYVVTGPAFVGAKVSYIGQGRVLVPTATWKAIYDPATHETGVYVCTNVQAARCTVHNVAALVRQTGVDPFPSLTMLQKEITMDLPKPEPGRHRR